MVTRIRQLLDWQQLTPTQFADLIGVGRPVVSHILSERNKPSLEVVQRIIAAFPTVSLPWLLSGIGNMLADNILQDTVPPLAAAQTSASPSVVPASLPKHQQVVSPVIASTAQAPVKRPTAAARANTQPNPIPARFVAPKPRDITNTSPVTDSLAPAAPAAPTTAAPENLLPTAEDVAAPAQLTEPARSAEPIALPTQAYEVPSKTSASEDSPLMASLGEPGKTIRRIVIFYQDGSFTDYKPEA